jgi:hypothetical protein
VEESVLVTQIDLSSTAEARPLVLVTDLARYASRIGELIAVQIVLRALSLDMEGHIDSVDRIRHCGVSAAASCSRHEEARDGGLVVTIVDLFARDERATVDARSRARITGEVERVRLGKQASNERLLLFY